MTGAARLASMIEGADSVVALTGAGISVPSGIPDFRSPQTGLWTKVNPMEVAHIDAFRRDPERFWSFYGQRFDALEDKQPNRAHQILAELEQAGLLEAVITQNIDRLHGRAGSRNVVEVHGSIATASCMQCGDRFALGEVRRRQRDGPGGVPACDCGAPLKPDVVLFGELLPVDAITRAETLAGAADVLLCIGSSLEVYPVAGLPELTLGGGGKVAIITQGPTSFDRVAAVRMGGDVVDDLEAVRAALRIDAMSFRRRGGPINTAGNTHSTERTAMTEPQTQTLELPGATLTYDVRAAASASTDPALLMIGSPMDASGFTTLAAHFPDRTVVTYDPRGVGRSPRADGATAATPEEHAEDLHQLISALGAGPVDIFASSGGAVNALALVTHHPEQVRTLVAHEPPIATVLPDRAQALAATDDIHETYGRAGLGPAMAKFIAFTSVRGPIPSDFPDRAPDPADFGLTAEDDGSRDHPLLGRHMVEVTRYEPDFDSLRGVSTRIVVAGGADSEGTFPERGARAVAEGLGTDTAIFPSHHGGFLEQGDPPAFAATLRRVLAGEPV